MTNIQRVEAIFTKTEGIYNRGDIASIQNQLLIPIAKEVQGIALSIAHISNSKSIVDLLEIAENLESITERIKSVDAAVHIIAARIED